jgi:DNA-binding response OmpR family regulator
MKKATSLWPANPPASANILIVDDNRDFVDFLKLLLARDGFHVRSAYSGKECLEAVRGQPVDLLILDVMMPKMDGLQVCEQLKKIAPSLPVILLTAKDDLATRAAAMNFGVSEFIAKPVNIADFLTRVRMQIHACQWGKNVDAAFSTAGGGAENPAAKD